MKKTILPIICLFLVFPAVAQYTVSGGSGIPYLKEEPANGMQVYLLNGLSGAEITFTANSDTHQWYKYTIHPGDAVAIPCQQTGNTSVITDVSDGCGYFVESNPRSYIWIIDYSQHVPEILSLDIEEDENRCTFLKLKADVKMQALEYRNFQGNPGSLERIFHLAYNTLEWNEDALTFVPKAIDREQTHFLSDIYIDPAPLTATTFTLTGDQYAQHFGRTQTISTREYEAVALEVHARAITRRSDGTEAIIPENNPSIPGEAPLEIQFEAYANQPVAARYIWEVKRIDMNTGDSVPVLRYPDPKVNYIFQESGMYAAQAEAIDAYALCPCRSTEFTIAIEDSHLRLPNIFSPGSSPGVNDIYRVAHKSLLSFKASIYNRWGNLLYRWEDPNQGWDGKVNGKYVPTGVYFIVVEAKGADGKVYTQSRDINILRSKNN